MKLYNLHRILPVKMREGERKEEKKNVWESMNEIVWEDARECEWEKCEKRKWECKRERGGRKREKIKYYHETHSKKWEIENRVHVECSSVSKKRKVHCTYFLFFSPWFSLLTIGYARYSYLYVYSMKERRHQVLKGAYRARRTNSQSLSEEKENLDAIKAKLEVCIRNSTDRFMRQC